MTGNVDLLIKCHYICRERMTDKIRTEYGKCMAGELFDRLILRVLR